MDLEELLLWGRGIFYLWLIYALISWFIRSGIESWRTKDEEYRRDCVVIPICAVIFWGWDASARNRLPLRINSVAIVSLCEYREIVDRPP